MTNEFAQMAGGEAPARSFYPAYLMLIAGLGGLLYGIDVGIIAGALPYLEAAASESWKLNAQQLSFVVAAVLMGSVLSSLFAGALADWVGRKACMILAGATFSISIPVIAMADSYYGLLLGRLLQGISGGLIGVVVPLYLAECLSPRLRGRGTALFQLLLTIGLVAASLIGLYFADQVETASQVASGAELLAIKDHAWRSIFWISLVPGLAFTAGTLALSESPRWLARRGQNELALQALNRSSSSAAANSELERIRASLAEGQSNRSSSTGEQDSLLSRRYVAPFLLACVILACNQATGINSILAYAVNILDQAGLPGTARNLGDVGIKIVNALMTVVALILVDRKGRKFLLSLGSAGIVVSLTIAGVLFLRSESKQVDVSERLRSLVQGDAVELIADEDLLRRLGAGGATSQQLVVAYSYGGVSNVVARRIDVGSAAPLRIRKEDVVQDDGVVGAAFRGLGLNPFPDPVHANQSPLVIQRAAVGPVPDATHGWMTALCIVCFVAFFAVGPGVCVWLALSELMPNRIRSNGMSVALLINQFVSTSIAAVFLPTVGAYGYSSMFFFWAGCSVIYFIASAYFLPETKGKSLEEIEAHFRSR